MTKSHLNVRYNLDETFFDVIDTEEKAYVLGFIMADGCISKSSHKLVINLKSTDDVLLEDIKTVMKYDGPLRYYDGHTSVHKGKEIRSSRGVTLCIVRKRIAEGLKKHGVTPAKSLTLGFPSPSIMETNLWRHFIRGYFDGDGTVHVGGESCCLRWSICGTLNFCVGLGEVFSQNDIRHNKIASANKYNGLHTIHVGGHYNLKRLWTFLYAGSTIWLERKRAIMDGYFLLPYRMSQNTSGYPGVFAHEGGYRAFFRNRMVTDADTIEEAYQIREATEERFVTDGLHL